ncbi:MAG TPA: Smr/MutS family protein [Xanthobacteraceae bacterium]|jgi:DNA-nicking Smr family endonuclease
MSADDQRRRRLSPDERTLWGQITRSIVPLRAKAVSADRAGATLRQAKSRPKSPAPVSSPSTPLKRAGPLEPIERRLKQRLARGRVAIDARIDLHGKTQRDAYPALLGFLRRAQTDGARFVLVITGKGTVAGEDGYGRGVLRRQVPLWLALPEFRPYVSGFEDAHVGHGGEGALYVRLRRRRVPETAARRRAARGLRE